MGSECVSAAAGLEAFRAYQARRGYAVATQRGYDRFLEPFVVWVGGRSLREVSAVEVEFGWFEEWGQRFFARWGRVPAPRTFRNHFTSLRVFYGFLERFEMIDRNPVRRLDAPGVPRSQPNWLSPEEDMRLVGGVVTPLERFLVPFLRWTGLRSAEARAVCWRDVLEDEIWVRHSKTPNGVRMIPILAQLRVPLADWRGYQAMRGVARADDYVLATQSGLQMTHVQVWTSIKRVAHRADVRRRPGHEHGYGNRAGVSPHTLRRTYASDLLNRGVRLEVVSRLLGHAETRTTEHSYAILLDSRIAMEARAAYESHSWKNEPSESFA